MRSLKASEDRCKEILWVSFTIGLVSSEIGLADLFTKPLAMLQKSRQVG